MASKMWNGDRPSSQHAPSGGVGLKIAASWNMDARGRRNGPRCDACGVACGSFAALAKHLAKAGNLRHAGHKETIAAQADRVGEVLAAANTHRKAA